MSKQITSQELAEIVSTLLTNPESVGELESYESFESFMTDIAKVVCDHCGGALLHSACLLENDWLIGIHGNDSLPSNGGIWANYDKEGALFDGAAISYGKEVSHA